MNGLCCNIYCLFTTKFASKNGNSYFTNGFKHPTRCYIQDAPWSKTCIKFMEQNTANNTPKTKNIWEFGWTTGPKKLRNTKCQPLTPKPMICFDVFPKGCLCAWTLLQAISQVLQLTQQRVAFKGLQKDPQKEQRQSWQVFGCNRNIWKDMPDLWLWWNLVSKRLCCFLNSFYSAR